MTGVIGNNVDWRRHNIFNFNIIVIIISYVETYFPIACSTGTRKNVKRFRVDRRKKNNK